MPRTHGNPYIGKIACIEGLPRANQASRLLYAVAAKVEPIMAKRGWRVDELVEGLFDEWGRNYGKGTKIALRLRYLSDPSRFLPVGEIVDILLHELVHIIWGDVQNEAFYGLLDQLRAEYSGPQLDWRRHRSATLNLEPKDSPAVKQISDRWPSAFGLRRYMQLRKGDRAAVDWFLAGQQFPS